MIVYGRGARMKLQNEHELVLLGLLAILVLLALLVLALLALFFFFAFLLRLGTLRFLILLLRT